MESLGWCVRSILADALGKRRRWFPLKFSAAIPEFNFVTCFLLKRNFFISARLVSSGAPRLSSVKVSTRSDNRPGFWLANVVRQMGVAFSYRHKFHFITGPIFPPLTLPHDIGQSRLHH